MILKMPPGDTPMIRRAAEKSGARGEFTKKAGLWHFKAGPSSDRKTLCGRLISRLDAIESSTVEAIQPKPGIICLSCWPHGYEK